MIYSIDFVEGKRQIFIKVQKKASKTSTGARGTGE